MHPFPRDLGHLNAAPGSSSLSGMKSGCATPVRQDCGGQQAHEYQKGRVPHHRQSGVNEVLRILPCTCGRAALDARRLLLLISGNVECNPGPQIRGAQWNSGGLSQAKRVALERKLHEDMASFCLLQEARLASAECAALKIGGYQHVGQARTPHGGGASILVRDGVGVEVGVLEKKIPESDNDTEVLSQCESHDRIGALAQKDRRSHRAAEHLAGSKRAIGGRSGRELTPRAVSSVASE
ncbi:hypothetical protein ERJ75_000128200 [Trypanosoma vivax]|uniref:Uncharacterized protein n=1 Tax=Trypanosoma vivax (strain Y486) TaxID=1055687 RepID=F9WPF5_TRYVY|nr:hypothetical protein ERJ75_000128200 [Trypanosoma vivax]CCD19432.1 hypothetical protein, conserved [Trypanosoma vivax Y486]|eukprot:CCD19432.1 hypothetical protein, conserved [Trypanosoma vivax Y486]